MTRSFESSVIDLESSKLKYYADKTNQLQEEDINKNLFINQSLTIIIHKVFTTIIDILNDLTKISSPKEMLLIFVKSDRLIYVGIIGIIIAFCMYIVDVGG